MKDKLTMTESDLAVKFYDDACDYQLDTFEQTARRVRLTHASPVDRQQNDKYFSVLTRAWRISLVASQTDES